MGLSDYLTQTYSQQGTQAGQQQQQTQGQYNAAQQGLQGGLGGFYNQLLQGSIPQQFTSPQAPMDAYNANFQNSVAPGMAAQYGAGSPAIASQQALGMQQLQGQLYNTGVNNYMNALGGAGNYAFQQTGQTGQGSNVAGTTLTGDNTTQINPLFSMLMTALGNQLIGMAP